MLLQLLIFPGKLVLRLLAVGVGLVVLMVLVVAVRYWSWTPEPAASFYEKRYLLNWGHRGAPEAAPENTLSSFEAAVELGADGVELDVMLSADGKIVVIHDYNLDKTTDGTGPVKNYSLAELKQLDAGYWFSGDFAGEYIPEHIPTLQEVIDDLDSSVFLNIEIKSESPATDGLEKAVVQTIARNNLYERVIVSSFNPISLLRVKLADKRIDVGLIYAPDLPKYLSEGWFISILRPEALHPHYDMVNEDYMAWARKKGFRVNVWTVNETAEMAQMIELGVDGIITDRPDVLRQLLQ
ncbi:MAG: glycerophosphodiester phosphodiesterase family protein [Bacillota bacterium]|nr:glycerophosphodiester phosphodiesterase family protein [Bacillota bacterium]